MAENSITGLYLAKPQIEDASEALEMMNKWRAHGGRINPGLLRRLTSSYAEWLDDIQSQEKFQSQDRVPQTLYFLKNSDGAILGAVSLRHYLDQTNILDGGHVGYGICPEHRGKGYGHLILALAVEKLVGMGIHDILVTCDADNVISQKVIAHNNGILENQARDEDGILINRYWIHAGHTECA